MHTVYDKIGNGYDTTRRADTSILEHFNSILNIKPDKKYLDIACGTGNYTSKIVSFGGIWSAFDNSELILTEAKNKSKSVQWSNYDVEQTNYKSNYFDGSICSLAIHHFPNLSNAFKEVSRITKPTGKVVLFTATPEQMYSYWLNEYFPNMMKKSSEQMPILEHIKESTEIHGLKVLNTIPFFIEQNLEDFFLYSGKQRPEMYLSKSVRDGISSFRNLCTAQELCQGLSRLQTDIESGVIHEVIKKYDNKTGDYLFVVLSKI